jgi:hypothetical protein
MSTTKTDRSNCRFLVQQNSDGKPVVMVQLLHQTIPALRDTTMGFGLLGGIRSEDAKKLVDLLNEYVLDIFTTVN